MSFLPLDILYEELKQHTNIDLSDKQLIQFDKYAELLVEKNKFMNLTRILDPIDIIKLHIIDSLVPLRHVEISKTQKIIDIGTGAGFPGIPLKIIYPDVDITLLDSTAKKIQFVRESAEKIGLNGIEYIISRAEEIGKLKKYREKFDCVFSRALSCVSVCSELSLPLIKLNGKLITYKGEQAKEELNKAKPIIGQLGGKPSGLFEYDILGNGKHYILIIEKVKSTPNIYPREYS
ncbi:MAG: 16S rRNA (guanine(527)-N(7))-methyltransferase RsmG, partial [Armatimonadota bacterium]